MKNIDLRLAGVLERYINTTLSQPQFKNTKRTAIHVLVTILEGKKLNKKK